MEFMNTSTRTYKFAYLEPSSPIPTQYSSTSVPLQSVPTSEEVLLGSMLSWKAILPLQWDTPLPSNPPLFELKPHIGNQEKGKQGEQKGKNSGQNQLLQGWIVVPVRHQDRSEEDAKDCKI